MSWARLVSEVGSAFSRELEHKNEQVAGLEDRIDELISQL